MIAEVKEIILSGQDSSYLGSPSVLCRVAMLTEPVVVHELILIGDYKQRRRVVVSHSTTFVRLERRDKSKKKDVPVLVHLDFNFPKP
jgi:hypothetical protein